MFGRKDEGLGKSRVETVIGRGVEIKGSIESSGTMRVDGLLEGTISHAGELIVGPKGLLTAKVRAKTMAVAGEVRGELEVEGKLELLSTAVVQGDIRCGNLVVHEGARFQGQSMMLAAAADHQASGAV